MESNNLETKPIGNNSQAAVATPKPEGDKDQNNELVLRLTEAKISARAHAQTATNLFNKHFSEPEEVARTNVRSSNVQEELKALSGDEELLPSEFVARSKQALQSSTQSKDQALAEKKALEEQIYSHEQDLRWRISERIKNLEEVKGIRKIPAFIEKKRLEGQKVNTQRQIERLRPQAEAKGNIAKQIDEMENPVREKQEEKRVEIIIKEIGGEIRAIQDGYEKLMHEVFRDGSVTTDIQKAYIEQVITPVVDKVAKERKFSSDQIDLFYKTLQTSIDHREEPEDQKRIYQQELDRLFTYETGFWEVKDYCEPLLNGRDKTVISKLIARMAAEDIIPISEMVNPHLRSWSARYNFEHIFDAKRDENGRANPDDDLFGRQIFSEINSKESYTPNMEFWVALKSSKGANEVFGNSIQQQDKEYYASFLNGSLSDTNGTDIDGLYYYPTPDAIRNLVILASADYSNYRTVHANWTLDRLQKRPDWGQILDATEVAYPTLKEARPVLQSWHYREYANFPSIQGVAGGLATSVYKNVEVDSRLVELSIAALPNRMILDILSERKIIQQSDVDAIKSAGEIFEKNYREVMQKDSNIPYVEEHYFKNRLRENLFTLLRSKEGETNPKQIEAVKRIGTLSRYILDNQQNHQVLRYLASESVVTKLLDQSLKAEDISLFLEAHKRLPTLLTDSKLLQPFVMQFTDSQSVEYFGKILSSYGNNSENIQEVVKFLVANQIDKEIALAFPLQASTLMDEKMRETRLFIFEHGKSLLKDNTDIKFLNSLVGEFGRKSDSLIRGYQECLEAKAITNTDKDLVIEFARQFRVISPITIQGYKEAKQGGVEKVYITQLQALAERMTGSGLITEDERQKPYYKDLLKHVYSNNSGQWTNFESNETCLDRSGDLEGFKISQRYEIDLLTQSEIRVKSGEILDESVRDGVQKPILEVAEKMNSLGNDKEKIQAALLENIDKTLQEILQKGGLQGIDTESATTIDEKLFLILTDSIYGSRSVDSTTIKNLIITYEFTTFEDISDYIAGTRDRVGLANNQDYALLCEVGAFYSDRIKEVNRRLVQTVWNNPAIAMAMPEYFKNLAQETTAIQRKDLINRLQIEKLGASESFVEQVRKVLEKRGDKKYSPEDVRKIIQRYESWTQGLSEKTSTSPKPATKALYGQLRSQREKTFEALKIISGQEVDPKQAHLGEINLQQAMDTEKNIREGQYDGEQFASYTVQRFIDLFGDERAKIDRELSKFESLSGKQREILHGYVTKSKESAHARMVGGVCVSGDNPGKYPDKNMWTMPNYLQMVFQEPDTLQCQGLVLMHHFDEGGKKILTASFNPSSTYLYSVDESALFNGISSSLEQFATENGFDMVAIPQNKTIRTNRTGGEFERAMDRKVSQIGKTFKFNTAQQFSYHPNYQIQDMDIIWEKS